MARLRTDVPRARRGRTTLPGAAHPNPLLESTGGGRALSGFGSGFLEGVKNVVNQAAANQHTAAVLAPGPKATQAAATVAPPSHSGGTSGNLTVPGYTPSTPVSTVPYSPTEPGHSAEDFARAEAAKARVEAHRAHQELIRRSLAQVAPLAAPTLAGPTATSQLIPGGSEISGGDKFANPLDKQIALEQIAVSEGLDPYGRNEAEGRRLLAKLPAAAPVSVPHVASTAPVADRSYSVQTPQGVVKIPAAAVAASPKDPLGKETLGNVSLPQLRQAAQAGTLNVSQKGVLSTQQGRNVLADLLAAHKEVQASTGLTGPLTSSQKQFAKLTSQDLGGVLSPRTIAVQELQEQSGQHAIDRQNEGNFDTLDIGYTDSGPISLTKNSDWGDVASAAKATAEFFKGERFNPGAHIPEILEESKGKSVAEQLQIIGNSGWATSSYAADLANTAALVGEKHDPEAVANLVAAKHAAVKNGINPTPWNGDVQGGSSDYVTIRADAKGALNWAESAVGTQQGDPRQLHWAAITHGPEDPWCSEFVGAAMARQGIELPADPAYSGSWLKWKGGTNLGTDTSKLKPGDLMVFGAPGGEAEHVGIYKGDGEMISGNFSNEVALSDVEEEIGAAGGLQGIVRPKYKGGTLKVKAGSLPGSSAGSVPGNEGSTGTSGGEVIPSGSSEAVPVSSTSSASSPGGAATREAALADFSGPAAPNLGGNIFESGQPSEVEEAIRLLTQASTRVNRA